MGGWSVGTKTEQSILTCYLDTIRQAQHFIYIENQFFVSSLAGDGVVNPIAEALVERIVRAHSEGKAFRVLLMLSLHPEGDFISSMESKYVMHYQYSTINRGAGSIFGLLKARVPEITVEDYFEVFSLRNWGVMRHHQVVSDQIYIHAKVMIVDDRVMIVGSANINDRSMLGDRDSEVAVIIEDRNHVQSVFNRQPCEVGSLSHDVRVKLMREHICDPTAGEK